MEKLEKLVFCHYNMRLRVRNLKRKNDEDLLIDLDHMFEHEDPLGEWIREREDPVFDGTPDNPVTQFLDGGGTQEEVVRETPRPSQVVYTRKRGNPGKRPVVAETRESSGDSSGDSAAAGVDVGGRTEPTYTEESQEETHGQHVGASGSGGRDRDADQRYTADERRRDRDLVDSEGYVGYGYTEYASGSGSEIQQQSEGQEYTSPYDGLMTSFFGCEDFARYYPGPGGPGLGGPGHYQYEE